MRLTIGRKLGVAFGAMTLVAGTLSVALVWAVRSIGFELHNSAGVVARKSEIAAELNRELLTMRLAQRGVVL